MHYIALDTETGGTRPGKHALLSIAAVCTWNDEPFVCYITPESQPGKTVQNEAAMINGYTPELWAERKAINVMDAMRSLANWLAARYNEQPNALMLAHNAGFDRMFLDEASTGLRLPIRHAWRCSMDKLGTLMDRGIISPGKANLDRLGTLSGQWEKDQRPALHDALDDARACLIGYKWLLQKEDESENTLRKLYTQSLVARRSLEDALAQIAVWAENGRKEGRPDQHLLEEVTELAKANATDATPSGASLITAERYRQIQIEGFSQKNDSKYVNGELRDAGIAYAMACDESAGEDVSNIWPWEPEWWKPSENQVRNLTKAGALLAAEIDRLNRKEALSRGREF